MDKKIKTQFLYNLGLEKYLIFLKCSPVNVQVEYASTHSSRCAAPGERTNQSFKPEHNTFGRKRPK